MNLIRRGVNIQDNQCPLCSKEEETIQHVIKDYEVAQKVWGYCDNWLGVSSIRHNDVVHHFMSFYVIGLAGKVICYRKEYGQQLSIKFGNIKTK